MHTNQKIKSHVPELLFRSQNVRDGAYGDRVSSHDGARTGRFIWAPCEPWNFLTPTGAFCKGSHKYRYPDSYKYFKTRNLLCTQRMELDVIFCQWHGNSHNSVVIRRCYECFRDISQLPYIGPFDSLSSSLSSFSAGSCIGIVHIRGPQRRQETTGVRLWRFWTPSFPLTSLTSVCEQFVCCGRPMKIRNDRFTSH